MSRSVRANCDIRVILSIRLVLPLDSFETEGFFTVSWESDVSHMTFLPYLESLTC